MFDWDDEELTNMIWGDDGETGDHIVPFKVRNRKEHGEEDSKAVKPAEHKTTGSKTDLHDSKLGSSSGHNLQPGLCMSSWPDSSTSNAREADPGPGSSETQLSKSLAEPARYDSTREKTSELGKGPDIFHSTATDESKEHQGDFDEYGWANIGSFDDLDRMFSSDVPIFGDGSLNGPDELWSSSSKDVSKPLLPSILDSQDLGLDITTEFEQEENQQFPLTGKANAASSQSVPRVRVTPKSEQYHEHHKAQSSVANQPYQQNKMMKFSEVLGTCEAGSFQDPYGQSRRKFVNHLAPSRSSMMGVNLQSESQGSGTSQYPHMPNQYMATSGFGNHTNPYSAVPVVSAFQRPDVNKNQLMHPSYNPAAISANMVTDARPSTMTPQEKLEKLRRRQQMQAMLAIQRQHQQFRHQVPLADQSITQNCCLENPLQLVDKTNLQGLTGMPSFDPSSSLQLDDSGNFTASVDNPSEFSVLYRLQDVVSKLDMGVRTCIRDSLFRLADSAGQRHHTSDKTSQDGQEVVPQEKSRYRYAGMLDTETVTNPTDRTVAHLLFHRPFDMSAAKHTEGLESPSSSKLGAEVKGSFQSRMNKQKAKEEDIPAGSVALPYAANSGSSSTVGERIVEASSQGNKRKL